MLFYSLALLITGLDQLLKFLVVKNLALGQSLPLIGQAVKLTYVRNTGAAFSLFVGFSPYLAAVGLIAALVVIYWHTRTSPKNILLQIGLAAVLGGCCGNLLDRVVRHYVIDYLDFKLWPVFNLADLAINLGVVLIAWSLFCQKEEQHAAGPV
jgi:signal peptidase II